ncbi:MAG: DUF1064 domain-containing protein [Clostridia bacterium]|nr:DUF1064 domain-containing protein [Clostridia bacterium]
MYYYNKNNKYSNTKITIDGVTYDSKKEARRHRELLLLERAGKITNLERQVKFELIPKQDGERACTYVADFVYTNVDTGERVVEDTKGFKTEVYRIKKKLMLWVHKIRIIET